MESHFPIPTGHNTQQARDRIIKDVQALVVDGELLLKATADDLSEVALAARERLVTMLKRARAFLEDCQQHAADTARRVTAETDIAIRAHPYKAIAIGAGVGFLAGLWLVARRRVR
jgi:ElaB/YqjD/DUF883 family membrane-anchored ribosome-binding protein